MISRQRQEIAQEFQKPLCFQILRRILRYREQQWLNIGLEQSNFIDQGRVEHHICAVLERENIGFLSLPHGRPHSNGGTGTVSAGSGIPFNSAQQSCIGGGNPVTLDFLSDAMICAMERWLLSKECMPPEQFVNKLKTLTEKCAHAIFQEMSQAEQGPS